MFVEHTAPRNDDLCGRADFRIFEEGNLSRSSFCICGFFAPGVPEKYEKSVCLRSWGLIYVCFVLRSEKKRPQNRRS